MESINKKIEEISRNFIELEEMIADKNYQLSNNDKEDVIRLIDIFQGITTNLRIRIEENYDGQVWNARLFAW